MKYKLINIATQEEVICYKEIIGTFDYYVNEISITEDRLFGNDGTLSLLKRNMVIATNDPDSELPKIIETYQFNEQDMIDFGKFAKSYKSSKDVENALITWKSQKPTTIYYQTTP